MRGDEQIVGPDHMTPHSQLGPDLGTMQRRFVRQVEHRDMPEKGVDCSAVLMPAWRQFDPEQQLSFS